MSFICYYSSISQTVISYELVKDVTQTRFTVNISNDTIVNIKYDSSIRSRVEDVDDTYGNDVFGLHYKIAICKDEGFYACRISYFEVETVIVDSEPQGIMWQGKLLSLLCTTIILKHLFYNIAKRYSQLLYVFICLKIPFIRFPPT